MSDCISQLQQSAVALGTSTYGTAAVSFARGLLVTNLTANPASQTVDRVPEVRGTLATTRVTKGGLDYDVTLGFPLDVSATGAAGIGDFLAALMGSDAGSVAGGVYTHAFTVSESSTPAYLNLYSTKDYVPKQIIGFRPTTIKFTIKEGDGFIPVEVVGIAKDESDLVAGQSLTFAAMPLMLPSNITTITVGGAAATNFEQVTITLKNDIERFRTLGTTRTINNAYRKTWSTEIALAGLNFANETQRTAYKDVTASAFNLLLTDSGAKTIQFAFPETHVKAFEGVNIADTDLLKINMTMFSTGTLANQVVTVKNTYAANYVSGLPIT
jgi:hypothetical protein